MRILQTIKIGYFIALFMVVMLLPVNAFSKAYQANNWLDEPVTVRFQNESLSKVLKKVSKQTGIAILYDQELANEKVSGNYKDVKASDAITRLFSGKNKSIQVSKDKKVIVVKTFGAKDFIWAGIAQGAQGKDYDSAPKTLTELEKMHAQQYKEYKERIANDNEVIDNGVGMTRGELRAMQEQQYKEYQTRISSNDDEIIEVVDTGKVNLTRGELRAMQEQQYSEKRKRIVNDNEMIEIDEAGKKSKTRGELRAMQENQYKSYNERIGNNDEIIEESDVNEGKGITRGALWAMQEQQKKTYKERLKDRTRIIEQRLL